MIFSARLHIANYFGHDNSARLTWILLLLFPLYQRADITATRGTEHVVQLTKSFALYRNRGRKKRFSKKVIRKISFQTIVFAQNLDERQSRYRNLKTVDFTLLTWTGKKRKGQKIALSFKFNFESGEGLLQMSATAKGVPSSGKDLRQVDASVLCGYAT